MSLSVERLKELEEFFDKIVNDKEQPPLSDRPKDVLATIRELIAIKETNKWQPIETAPKDETVILVCDSRYGFDNFGLSKWCSRGNKFICLDNEGHFWLDPTHWANFVSPNPKGD